MNEHNLHPEPGIAGKFISTGFDENGIMNEIQFHNTDNFNFAFDVVDALGTEQPDKLAMLHIASDGKERRITFEDMMKYSNKAANYFRFLGIKRGDRVMLVLKRHYQFWFAILGLHKIGAIAIPATYLLVRKDFEYRFKAAKVNAVLCTADGKVAEEVEKASKVYDGLKAKIMVGQTTLKGWRNFKRDIRYFSSDYKKPAELPGGDDPMVMFFTSGTTAYPKLAIHSYKYALGHYVTARYWQQVDPNGIHFTISDTGWAKAMWGKLYGQWLCEAAIFTYDFEEFYASQILQMIQQHKITTFCAPPTVYRVMAHMNLDHYDLSSLQNVTTAGEALNPEIYEKFYSMTGLKIMEGFGQTETTLTIGNIKGMEPKPGSMGRPNPQYHVNIMRPDGTLCNANETGEIVISAGEERPTGLFLGYYLDEKRTDSTIYGGYYHTNDTAYMDEDGFIWYVGRTDDVIKSTGYRVGPFEIENEIMKLPYVLEVAVTSIPDAMRGQAIKASVVLTEGTEASDALKKEMVRFFKQNLASYKRPKVIEFVKELPKTVSGKIRRVDIKDKDWAKENPSSANPAAESSESKQDSN
ncbi:MAG: AMP-binding protein [Lachnospiraceae bacterium]|nr:AMP-binding protein [Lachnospiraceae bacterium]